MSHDHSGHAQLAGQILRELVHNRGHHGVEAGSGFIAEKQFGIERERARQRDAFLHPAADFRRFQVLKPRQPHQFEFHLYHEVHDGVVHPAVFLNRQSHVLADGERLQQRAGLKEHSEPAANAIHFPFAHADDFLAENPDGSGIRSH